MDGWSSLIILFFVSVVISRVGAMIHVSPLGATVLQGVITAVLQTNKQIDFFMPMSVLRMDISG